MKGFNKIWHLLPSSPRVFVGDPLLLKKENDRFPITTFGNDGVSGKIPDYNLPERPEGRNDGSAKFRFRRRTACRNGGRKGKTTDSRLQPSGMTQKVVPQ